MNYHGQPVSRSTARHAIHYLKQGMRDLPLTPCRAVGVAKAALLQCGDTGAAISMLEKI